MGIVEQMHEIWREEGRQKGVQAGLEKAVEKLLINTEFWCAQDWIGSADPDLRRSVVPRSSSFLTFASLGYSCEGRTRRPPLASFVFAFIRLGE